MDMRIPVVLGSTDELASGDVALAIEEDAGSHVPGCACCQARGLTGRTLDRLFLARARGERPWFTRVVAICATVAAEESLRAALADDPIASARFRLATDRG